MDIEISLIKYDWHHEQGVSVTGYSWQNDSYLNALAITPLIHDIPADFHAFLTLVNTLNGQISIVVQKNGEIWLFTGHTWSYPVFYHAANGNIIITDSPEKLTDDLRNMTMNRHIESWFLHFGATPAGETLVSGIFQVRPGEIVRIICENGEITKFSVNPFSDRDIGPTIREFKTPAEAKELILRIFEKYALFLKNKKVLLPLTNGYDSRLLACLLKDFGHSNVLCATWGRSGSEEMKTAEKIASILGYPHLSVTYERSTDHDFLRDQKFQNYLDYAGHLSSMPYLQDYFPIKYLSDQKLIDNKTVVLPGHPGDFLRGSHLYASLNHQNLQMVTRNILSLFGASYPSSERETNHIKGKIRQLYFERSKPGQSDFTANSDSENSSAFRNISSSERSVSFDAWDYEERQCKFIGNSSLVYNYFGLDHIMPLFDRELLNFFLCLPFGQRLGSILYNETAEKYFFIPHRLDFALKKTFIPDHRFPFIKEKIIRNIPQFLKKRYYPVKDPIFYHELTKRLVKSTPEYHFRDPLRPHFYNCYLTQFYLQRVIENLKNYK